MKRRYLLAASGALAMIGFVAGVLLYRSPKRVEFNVQPSTLEAQDAYSTADNPQSAIRNPQSKASQPVGNGPDARPWRLKDQTPVVRATDRAPKFNVQGSTLKAADSTTDLSPKARVQAPLSPSQRKARAAKRREMLKRGEHPKPPRGVDLTRPGMPRLTAAQIAREKQRSRRARVVRYTPLGLARVNAHRAKKGKRPIEVEPAPLGQDLGDLTEVGMTPADPAPGAEPDDGPGGGAPGLPASVDNSVLKFFPPIGDQGSLNSCAQLSGAYYVMTYMWAQAHDIDAKAGGAAYHLSPKWTYNFTNSGSNVGGWYWYAYDIGIKNGMPTWEEFPYVGETIPATNYREWCLTPATWRNALNRRFDTYGYIDDVQTPAGIAEVKSYLNNGYVLNYATYIGSWQWMQVEDDPGTSADDDYKDDWGVYYQNGKNGYHAMTIVGYSDDVWIDVNDNDTVDSGEKGAFRICNSWTDGWADDGYAWIAYDAVLAETAVTGWTPTNRYMIFEDPWVGGKAKVHWVTARTNYQPKTVAKFTINHAKRAQLAVRLGTSTTDLTVPTTFQYPSFYCLYFDGGDFAFDGTTTAVDGTVYMDFTDIVPAVGEEKRWYAGINDNAAGSSATIKSFELYKVSNGNDQLVGTATNGPKSVDNGQTRLWVDWVYSETKTWFVKADAAGSNNGTSWTNAYTDLQSALSAASAEDEIWVAAGTYKPDTDTDRTKSFVMKADVPIYGGFAGTESARDQRDPATNVTILSGDIGVEDNSSDNSYHVVVGVTGGTLDGFTVTKGNANGSGIHENGGGVLSNGASPTVANCIIAANSAVRGGGIYNNAASPTITDCTFSTNTATVGAALFVGASSPTVTGCTIDGNTAASYGGGAFISVGSSPQFTKCLIIGNTATAVFGGGMYISASSPQITNCTYYANSAAKGGGLANTGGATPTLENCILWNNTATKGAEFYNSSSSPTVSYTCVKGGYAGTGNIDLDPAFVDAGGGDLHLKSQAGHWTSGGWVTDQQTSPCIDAGDPADSYTNEPAPHTGRINMGAYGNTAQASKRSAITIYVDADATGDEDGGSWTNAYTDLQDAMGTLARSGDTIWAAAGTYKPGTGRDSTFQLLSNVPVYGGFDGTETLMSQRDVDTNTTILSGEIGTSATTDNCYRVVTAANNSTLDGFTVQKGNANDGVEKFSGAGMYCLSVTATVSNCTFRDNSSDFFGGGLYAEDSTVTVSACRFIDNTSFRGGGLYNDNSSGNVSKTVFEGNVSSNFGGAVANTASSGGTWTNCAFAGNNGAGGGGAFFNHDSAPTLTNCTMSENTGSPGKALYIFSGSATLKNCIVWGGSTGLISGSPTVTYSCIQGGYSGTGNISTDPQLSNAPDFDGANDLYGDYDDGLRIKNGSPCANTGTATGAPADDIRGDARPYGAGIDMGAYEQGLADMVVFVDDSASGSNDGTSWTDAFTTLQAGIDAAETDGKEVWVATGTYKPTSDTDRTKSFTMKNGVAAYGGFQGNETARASRDWTTYVTILSGDIGVADSISDNSYHVVVGVTGGTLDGFTVTRGNANGAANNGNGGGLLNVGASPVIANCIFDTNSAARGGGIYNIGGSPTVSNCSLIGNSATNGGGLWSYSSSYALSGCTLTSNSATAYGGAIYNRSSSPTLSNCLLAANTAPGVAGGAVYNSSSSPAMTNCTFSGNSSNKGGAIANFNGSDPSIKNSILWGNTATSGNELYNSSSAPTISYSCIEGGSPGTGNDDQDPLFVDAAGGEYHLRSRVGHWTSGGWVTDGVNSPCIDTGDDGDDYSNEPEDNGNRINMGVYGNTAQASKYAPDSDIIYVDLDASGDNNGGTWGDAFTDLQDAISAATSGKEIWVATGTYKPTSDTDRTKSFTLENNVPIYGGFAGIETVRGQRDPDTNVTTLSGDIGVEDNNSDNSYHVVVGVTGGTLDGFTVTRGNASGSGNNANGAGMFNVSSSPTVSRCIFSENSAVRGGALYLLYSSPILTDCTADSNSASTGGGIWAYSSTVQLQECSVTGNTATTYGGGLYSRNSSPTLANCVFSGNSAVGVAGGAVHSDASSPSMINCTFAGNSSSKGGGLACYKGSIVVMRNCIVWGNTAGTGDQLYRSSSTVTVTYTCIQGGYAGTGNISTDPQFVNAGGGDFHLKSQAGRWNGSGWSTDGTTSPCIDTGDSSDAYDNEPTSNGSRINMGAYGNTDEASKRGGVIVYVDKDATGDNNGTSWANAYTELYTALSAVSAGSDIWVAEGTYKPTGGADRAVSLQMVIGVHIYGGFDGTETQLSQRDLAAHVCVLTGDIGTPDDDSDNSYHVVLGANGGVLDGFTITGAKANGSGEHEFGGGVFNWDKSPVIRNCIIRDNWVGKCGAGICNLGYAAPVIQNCTIHGNYAWLDGGGLHDNNSSGISSQLRNCILWDNVADMASEDEISVVGGTAPTVTYSCVAGGYTGTGNISTDPQFANAGGGDFHLKSQAGRWSGSGWSTDGTTSPCIDAGDPTDDYANEPEDNDDQINMGAYGNTAEASKSFAGGGPGAPAPGDPEDECEDEPWAPQAVPTEEEVPEVF